MSRELRLSRCDDRGFTLIELLVVILVIGILTAIAVPTFLNQRAKAYRTAAVADMKNVQTALETWATDHQGSYTELDGATHESAELKAEGYNRSAFVAIEVFVSDSNTYCIEGLHERFPGKVFRFRNTEGVTEILDDSFGCP